MSLTAKFNPICIISSHNEGLYLIEIVIMTSTTFSSVGSPKTLSKLTVDSTIPSPLSLDKSFAAIDWQAPWLCHLSELDYLSQQVQELSESKDNDDSSGKQPATQSNTVIAQLLNTALLQRLKNEQNQPAQTKPSIGQRAHLLKFVAQDALPEGQGYEHFIATTGNIPTRNNLHDLFNGSIWLTFPKTKALLNYYHMDELAKPGNGDSRGRVRDTITVFDENGAVLVTANPSIGEALIDFDWQGSLVTPRDDFDHPYQAKPQAKAAVYIFGHALLEQLIQPHKALCAHSTVIHVEAEFFALPLAERLACLDKYLADKMDELLSQQAVTPRQLAPLPILGVPHYWAQNADPSFYEDSYVFRSGRRNRG